MGATHMGQSDDRGEDTIDDHGTQEDTLHSAESEFSIDME